MGKRGRRRANRRRRNWQAPAVFCGFAVLFAIPFCVLMIPVLLRLEPYDGRQMYMGVLFLCAAMTTLCGLLVDLAPILPLIDGYALTTRVSFVGGKYGAAELPLWIVCPSLWAVASVLFVRTWRGLRRRLTG